MSFFGKPVSTFPGHALTGPRLRRQIDQRVAQRFRRCHALPKWQAKRRVALRKINAFRI
jgi:hypothetical protein